MPSFVEKLRSALALELPHEESRRHVARPGATPASVLVLFAESSEAPGDPAVLLSVRTQTVETHKGQIAFPGGMSDQEDESAIITALRETEEEVGIPRSDIEVLGQLPELATGTGFLITPIVAVSRKTKEELRLRPNPDEIDETFWAPLSYLLEPSTYRKEVFEVGGARYPIHVYPVGPHRVWGATAAIIKNLLDRIQSLG
jgi:8-oxo-dGTP pyrophosphatase MutT (NUDIX family)